MNRTAMVLLNFYGYGLITAILTATGHGVGVAASFFFGACSWGYVAFYLIARLTQ